ncbi:MAG: AIPR family protein [Acidobacteriaceae bacterium]
MLHPTKVLEIHPKDNEHIKRLNDPADAGLFHLETWLPFSEAVKLERGNANVRPASERKKPFKDMLDTVETSPSTFHRKNRGIIYLCERFEFDNSRRVLRVTVPNIPADDLEDLENGDPKFGIADGGHTYSVIEQTIARANELSEREGWSEPFVRVHFLAGQAFECGELEQVVEALNTSSQVQQYTLDEYQNKFDELKDALKKGGFDPELIAFRENEEKDWEVREVIQRLACFLKERWKSTQPSSMYKSKGKALDLYTSDASREEFRRLYDVAADVVTLPEFIQSEFSKGDAVKGRKFGKLRAVKTLKRPYTPPGTAYSTDHQMDLAASLPIAAAFRELLELNGDRYFWKVDYKEVFRLAAEELYRALLNKVKTAKGVNSLGADTEYWTQCANIVLRARYEVQSRQSAK